MPKNFEIFLKVKSKVKFHSQKYKIPYQSLVYLSSNVNFHDTPPQYQMKPGC